MGDDLLAQLLRALDRREAVALVTVTAGDGLGGRLLVWADAGRAPVGSLAPGLAAQAAAAARAALALGEHATAEVEGPEGRATLFVEVQSPPYHLVIAGAGHIAVPLAAIARTCDFAVTVIDDRAQFAAPARFPTADRVRAGDFRAELRALRDLAPFDARTCLVLVTRGHQHDVDCLLEVLDDPVGYVGMIGSKRRIRAVFDLLAREQGIPRERFARVRAPIGLDIGARTPAEIAVCIMAEIINVLRGGPGLSLSRKT